MPEREQVAIPDEALLLMFPATAARQVIGLDRAELHTSWPPGVVILPSL